ncbi:hypothetical protein GE061_000682 [Apolygus lucorum]|uniref:Uncharacterized protein n=1 Tax=Apolygus lucorum TaxID=248454 RepID=A0A8S9Y6X4_APOLU|nr:hypothetical protein GE061_000682 [Apolygus lucorum]
MLQRPSNTLFSYAGIPKNVSLDEEESVKLAIDKTSLIHVTSRAEINLHRKQGLGLNIIILSSCWKKEKIIDQLYPTDSFMKVWLRLNSMHRLPKDQPPVNLSIN